MENLAKALLIAAGMLLVMLLLTILVIGYNRISSHYELQHELITVEQLDKFNKQFQNYGGKVIRGNELISLMNKVIDYNASQSYQVGTGYKPIKVKIKIGSDDLVNSFKFENKGEKNDYIKSVIQNTVGDKASDSELVKIASTPKDLISDAASVGITINDTQLQKLTMEISNIIFDKDEYEYKIANQQNEDRRIRAIIFRNILKFNIGQYGKTDPGIQYDLVLDDYYVAKEGQDKINKIKEIVSKYYQYTQFKRAQFECKEVKIDTETRRVVEMNFEVRTKNGQVQFD